LFFNNLYNNLTERPEGGQMADKNREIITTSKAPRAIGPYSQGVRSGNRLFVSGQIGLDPATGTMVSGGIEPQTRQVFANLDGILKAAKFSFRDVVYVQVFLADMNDFAAMNDIYAEFFDADPPARAAIEAAALPKGALIEITLQAIRSH
jgi:2-iminobutanoate/2-iminopropanoate deaminase